MSYNGYYNQVATMADKIIAGEYAPKPEAPQAGLVARKKLEERKARGDTFEETMLETMAKIRYQNMKVAENPKLAFGGLEEAEAEMNANALPKMKSDPVLSFDKGYGDVPNMMSPSEGRDSLIDLIDRTEGGGRYDTLFGHSQRGGRFDGVDITAMPIREVLEFAAPSGQYGQWVKGQVGRVATPMGRYQYVGTTLRERIARLGIDPETKFSPEIQDRIFKDHVGEILASNETMDSKRRALRATWEGFKHVGDEELNRAIREIV